MWLNVPRDGEHGDFSEEERGLWELARGTLTLTPSFTWRLSVAHLFLSKCHFPHKMCVKGSLWLPPSTNFSMRGCAKTRRFFHVCRCFGTWRPRWFLRPATMVPPHAPVSSHATPALAWWNAAVPQTCYNFSYFWKGSFFLSSVFFLIPSCGLNPLFRRCQSLQEVSSEPLKGRVRGLPSPVPCRTYSPVALPISSIELWLPRGQARHFVLSRDAGFQLAKRLAARGRSANING